MSIKAGAALAWILLACAACPGKQQELAAREAECLEKGYPPATAALYECMHPEQAEALEGATEAWDQLERGWRWW